VIESLANDLNPVIEAQRRFMARWSCSTMLLNFQQPGTLIVSPPVPHHHTGMVQLLFDLFGGWVNCCRLNVIEYP
jgi:hypothetical protein